MLKGILVLNLRALCKKIADRLGIEPLDI